MRAKSFFCSLFALYGLASVAQAEMYELKSWKTSEYDQVENGLLVTATTDALGNRVSHHTDGVGLTRKSIDALGNAFTGIYDANGNLLSRRDANGNGRDNEFDARNRLVATSDTAGTASSAVYDANNLVCSVSDSKGEATSYIYDALNRRVTSIDRLGNVVTNYYDVNSNLTSIEDQEGKVTAYGYDELNRQVSIKYAGHVDGSTEDYDKIRVIYDALGRKKMTYDQNGDNVSYIYDMASRLIERNYSDGNTDSFSYDDASRLRSASKGRYNNIITFDYDSIGRLAIYTQLVGGVTREIKHSYDEANRHISSTMPSDSLITSVTHNWSKRNQLSTITAVTATSGTMQMDFIYDDGGRETQRTFANGLVQNRTYTIGDNSYASINMSEVDAASFSYAYDGNKNVVSEEGVYASWMASYDKLDRLTTWNKGNGTENSVSVPMQIGWQLSAVGNIESQAVNGNADTRVFNDSHELISVDGNALTYDGKGNRTSSQLPTQNSQLAWDNDNHMTEYRGESGNLVATYEYDALGRRIAKVLADGTRTDFLLNKKDQVCAEYVNNIADRAYCSGSYVDDQLLMVTDTEVYSLHRDRQFNTRAVTDISGTLVERYEYTPQGAVKIFDSSNSQLPTSNCGNMNTFTGRYFDAESGLYYFRARYFDSELNTFISRDPIGYKDGYSLYAGYFSHRYGIDPSGNVLIAVDGTGSKDWYKPNPEGGSNSHVHDFYDDYQANGDEEKHYLDGPNTASTNTKSIHREVIKILTRILCENPDEEIVMVGHSRGGHIVMEVARELQKKGIKCCKDNPDKTSAWQFWKDSKICCKTLYPTIKFMGLYDPVDMTPFYGDSDETVPGNVDDAAVAYGDPDVGSRPYFNTADGGQEEGSGTNYHEATFDATHGGVGGDPWGGDHPEGMTEERDQAGSLAADGFIRDHANNAGVRL